MYLRTCWQPAHSNTPISAVVVHCLRTLPSPRSHPPPCLHPPVTELQALGQLDNTYVVFSSDNGYHLGSFGLSEGKALPIEEDIRVPFYVRGPGLGAGQQVAQPGSFVDVAPTVMALAGEWGTCVLTLWYHAHTHAGDAAGLLRRCGA